MRWDEEFDVLIVGSGAAGFSAALTAQLEGLDTLIIEKEDRFGGVSALSGGNVWIPNNRYLEEAGVNDSYKEAKRYLDVTVSERVSDSVKDAYLYKGIEMLDYFYHKTEHMRFSYIKNYADYYAHFPGGNTRGRSIEPLIFDRRKLGSWEKLMKNPIISTREFTITGQDFQKVNMITRTFSGKLRLLRLGFRRIKSKITGAKFASLGQALIARLALSYKEAGGELTLNTAFSDFIIENDRVVGIKAVQDGKERKLKARNGVILGVGGFSRNQNKREEYLPKPTNKQWTSSPSGQTGDILSPAAELGARFDLMDKVRGAPSILDHNGRPFFLVAERGIPSMIITDQVGHRYLNEALPYHEFTDLMYEHNKRTNGKAIPSWFIIDKRTKWRYFIAGQFPWKDFPKEYYDHDIVRVGDTITELAENLGMDRIELIATIERFNQLAKRGRDEDFGRGEVPYDRYYGDPTLRNSNLDTINNGPYYALRVYPGDIGTKGGVVIDEKARILKEDGLFIKGLYAAGNCSASVMGESYPGPGAALGSAMTFGYIAALECRNDADGKN